MTGYMAQERDGYISTSGLKSDVTVVFFDPDFLDSAINERYFAYFSLRMREMAVFPLPI